MWCHIAQHRSQPLFLVEVSWAWFFQLWHGKPHPILLQILLDALSVCNMNSACTWWQHLHHIYQQTATWYADALFIQLSDVQFGAFLHYRYDPQHCGRDVIPSLQVFLTWSATAVYSAYKALKRRHMRLPSGISLRDIALYYHPQNIHSAQSNYIITRNQFPLLDAEEHEEVRGRHSIQEAIRRDSACPNWQSPWRQLPLPSLIQSASTTMCGVHHG